MYIKPKQGLKIPDPALLDFLPEAGREVEENSYWLRRLRDKDVVKSQSPKPQAKTKTEGEK